MRYILVGTGNISKTYVAALAAVPEAQLVGCVSRKAEPSPGAFDLPRWPSLKAVDRDFDAVILATPNGLHHQGAVEAAALGKHVLTEKPLDITLAAMDEMMAACKRAGVTLGVSYQRRTKPCNRAIKCLLEQKRLGRVFAADVSAKFYRHQAYYDSESYRGGLTLDGGGAFMQQACHNLDLYTWFFGLPEQVASMMGTFMHEMESEDHGAALMRHPDGMIGTIVASTATWPGFSVRLEVHAERGSFTLTNDDITDWHVEGVGNPALHAPMHPRVGTAGVKKDTSAHQAVIQDFEAAVREGREPLAGAASARRTSELILRIYDGAV